jgi:hypothetical protein
MSWKELINWGELSRIMAGSRMTIRKNKIPKKHDDKIKELQVFLEKWLESFNGGDSRQSG